MGCVRPTPAGQSAPDGRSALRPYAQAHALAGGRGVRRAHATERDCEACGAPGREYRPFSREEPWSYRAFAYCGVCGACEEF
jgi:hypothetical protein